MDPQSPIKTPVVVIGTLGELEQGFSPAYLTQLSSMIEQLHPELLIAEIPRQAYEQSSARLPREYAQGLLPLTQLSDTVIVPVGSPPMGSLLAPGGGWLVDLRRLLVEWLNALLVWLQGHSPRRINSPLFNLACQGICHLTQMLCGPAAKKAWKSENQQLLDNILAAIRHDPGRRVTITLDCRRKHPLVRKLAKISEVQLLEYRNAVQQHRHGEYAAK